MEVVVLAGDSISLLRPMFREYTVYRLTPFEKLNGQIGSLLNKSTSEKGFTGFKRATDTKEFIWQLHYRLMDMAKSYVLLTYFFEKGIPDKEWKASPSRSGASIEWFPHFEAIHHEIKDWFDYYSDIFYYKLFSALDMVGHILNVRHDLRIDQEQVTFRRAVARLANKDQALYGKLDRIRNLPAFQEANRLRNNITHNYLPGSTGISVTLTEKGGGIGVGDYTTSAEIMSNVRDMLSVIEQIVSVIMA